MSDATIDQAINASKLLPPDDDDFEGEKFSTDERRGIDLSILKSPTGPGSIDDYMDHPLNFAKSRGLAQMIRGVTGFLGSLDFALVDVIFGFLAFNKERKAAA